jgi:hypothetical protein
VSSLQQRAEASVSSPSRSKASQQRTATEHPTAGIATSQVRASSCLLLGQSHGPLETMARRQAHGENDGARAEYREHIQCHGRHNDRDGTALAPRGPGARRLGVTCMTRASPSVFEHPTLSSCLTVKPITGSSKRSTTLHAGQSGWIVTYFSFSSFPSTWLTCPELGSITCPKTRSIAGRI